MYLAGLFLLWASWMFQRGSWANFPFISFSQFWSDLLSAVIYLVLSCTFWICLAWPTLILLLKISHALIIFQWKLWIIWYQGIQLTTFYLWFESFSPLWSFQLILLCNNQLWVVIMRWSRWLYYRGQHRWAWRYHRFPCSFRVKDSNILRFRLQFPSSCDRWLFPGLIWFECW